MRLADDEPAGRRDHPRKSLVKAMACSATLRKVPSSISLHGSIVKKGLIQDEPSSCPDAYQYDRLAEANIRTKTSDRMMTRART